MAGMVAAFCCSIASAQTIYFNAFNGEATTINGTAPTIANDFAGGTSSATWNDVLGIHDTSSTGPVFFGASGSVPGAPDSLLLPFTPQSGYVYTLTASVTFTGNPLGWVGLGFAQNDSVNLQNGGRFADPAIAGWDWMIGYPGSMEQWFAGPRATPVTGLAGGNVMPTNGTYTWQVSMDASGSLWTIACYINGTQFGTDYTYASNPTIGAVGITENFLGAPTNVQWSDFTLSAAQPVPEPATPDLVSVGLTMLFLATLYRGRRNTAAQSMAQSQDLGLQLRQIVD